MITKALDLVSFFPYRNRLSEVVGIYFLDMDYCLLGSVYFYAEPSDWYRVKLSSKQIRDIALTKNARRVVLIHNHPGISLVASACDIELKNKLRFVLQSNWMHLSGFIIVTPFAAIDYV